MKIIVYTILKNELKNIREWLENVKDADGIYLLDTGSTDGSWELLNSPEIRTAYPKLHLAKTIIDPWRFDRARNVNLQMVLEDPELADDIKANQVICWTIDLDERFHPDWYEVTKREYEAHPNFRKLRYPYACSHDIEGNPININIYDKCHRLTGARWSLPIHEILTYGDSEQLYSDGEINILFNGVLVHHYQNLETNREDYKDLLKMRMEADRYDLEAMNHYCTELLKDGNIGDNFDKVLDILMVMYGRAIQCNCSWVECICGNIANQLEPLNYEETCNWYEKAIKANPILRTYYLREAYYVLNNGLKPSDPVKAISLVTKMLSASTVHQEMWKEMPGNWTYGPHEILGIAYYLMGNKEEAINEFQTALENMGENDDVSVVDRLNGYITQIQGDTNNV